MKLNNKDSRKNTNIVIRCSSSEKEQIRKNASAMGYANMSLYIRKMLESPKVMDRQTFLDIHNAVYHLSKIGNNINQIAHRMNTGIYSEHDKKSLVALMRRCNDTLSEILRSVNGE